jgi:hypothetical protein
MRLDKHLPPNAIQIRYVHPYFEGVYDDEDNFVEEYCTNEDTATDVYQLIRKAHREKQSYYYRRRTSQLSSDDTKQYRAWTDNQHAHEKQPRYNIKVRKLGRRVVIEYNPEYAHKIWKMKQHTGKPRHKAEPKVFMDAQTAAQERARLSIESMFRDMDLEEQTREMQERNEHE